MGGGWGGVGWGGKVILMSAPGPFDWFKSNLNVTSRSLSDAMSLDRDRGLALDNMMYYINTELDHIVASPSFLIKSNFATKSL